MLYHSSFVFDMISHVAQTGPKFSMQVPIRLYTQVMKRTTCRQFFLSTMRVLKIKLRSSAWRKVSLPTEASHWFLMSSFRDWISYMRMACCNVRLPFMVGLFHACPLAFYFPSCYNLSRAFNQMQLPGLGFLVPRTMNGISSLPLWIIHLRQPIIRTTYWSNHCGAASAIAGNSMKLQNQTY